MDVTIAVPPMQLHILIKDRPGQMFCAYHFLYRAVHEVTQTAMVTAIIFSITSITLNQDLTICHQFFNITLLNWSRFENKPCHQCLKILTTTLYVWLTRVTIGR